MMTETSKLESFTLEYPAHERLVRRAHVGVVGSGDLEILLEPGSEDIAVISVSTRVAGHRPTWTALFSRFIDRHPYRMRLEIRDAGATPGAVWLRLEQAIEVARQEDTR
jgi:malonate decarboxylase delta subunit